MISWRFQSYVHIIPTCTYIHTYVLTICVTYVRTYICTYVCVYVRVCTCVRKHVCIHVYLCACLCDLGLRYSSQFFKFDIYNFCNKYYISVY
jgi:hypothetical protein